LGQAKPAVLTRVARSPPAFDLAKGGAQEETLALHLTPAGRPDDRPGNRLGNGAMPETVEGDTLGPAS